MCYYSYLDKVDIKSITTYEKKLIADMKVNTPEILEELRDKAKISDKLEKELKAYINNFTNNFIKNG